MENLFDRAGVVVEKRVQIGTTKNALLPLKLPFLALSLASERVLCEGREWSRGAIRNTRSGPALPRSYPARIRCIKNTCGSPEPLLHQQIVPGDWPVRLISLLLHKHANRNNTGFSFIAFTSHHLYVKSINGGCMFVKTNNCTKCSFFFFF